MYIIITVGAFLPSTVRGLLHTYTPAFIANYYSRIRYNTFLLLQNTIAKQKFYIIIIFILCAPNIGKFVFDLVK